MIMAKEPKRKARKRGPKEERLVITEDPKTALDPLLNPRGAKAAFDAAHKAGMKALKDRDYEALGKAIVREKVIIERMAEAIERIKGTRKPEARGLQNGIPRWLQDISRVVPVITCTN